MRVCPDSEDVVVTCNQSVPGFNTLLWVIEVPSMLIRDTVFVSAETPVGVPLPFASPGSPPLPGITLILHNISDTTILSSVTVNTSHYNLTGSRISVACGQTMDKPSTSIQLWGMGSIF